MSNTAFAKMQAKSMPSLACVGQITELGPVAVAKSGVYLTCPIKLSAYGAGRGQTTYFTFNPGWLTEKFHLAVADAGSVEAYFDENFAGQTYEKDGVEKDVPRSFKFVYASNISNADGTSFLDCLFPGDKFDEFAAKAFSLDLDDENPDLEAMTEFFTEQMVGRKIGYVLQQARIDTGKTDDDGKKIYIKDNNYNLKNFFAVDKKRIASLEKSAAKSKTGFKLTFTPDEVLD
jgi:hypothetical protein